MKKNNLSFSEGLLGIQAQQAKGKPQMIFDWDKAAEIIKEKLKEYPNLVAEAGLLGDWDYTGGIIFEEGKINTDSYTYLSSNWATPTLLLSYNNNEEEEIGCFVIGDTRFNSESKWDEKSIELLNK